MKGARVFAVSLAGMLCAAGVAWSQSYPMKPVRVIVPFPPGGANDIVARIVLPKLSEQMGQSFIIENRSGAGGSTGTAVVAQSKPDGYTLLLQTAASHASNPHLYSKLPYDALKDFTGVTGLSKLICVLTVHPSMPVRSVKEFIALARQRPKEILLGHAGYGSFVHLNAVLFESKTNLKVTEVPFKGGGPAVVGLISGETQAMMAGIGDIIEHIKARRVRALGVAAPERVPQLPDVPPIADTLPGYDVLTWVSLFAPAATPRPIIDQLNSELGNVLRDRDIASKMTAVSYDPVYTTPEELNERVRKEYETIGQLFRQFNVRIN